MLFVIEGTDGAGKTTLANEIEWRLEDTRHRRIIRRHFGPPEQHPLAEYERWLDFYGPNGGEHVIIDRFHWGEMVYADYYRDGSQLGQAGYWHIEQYLRSRGALMIYACGDEPELARRQAEKNEDFLQPEHASDVLKIFDALATNSLQDVAIYDSTRSKPGEAAERAIDVARRFEHSVAGIAAFPSYVGGTRPQLLLVGDQPNDTPLLHDAAFPPYPSTSGRYLLEALLERLSPDQYGDIGICNAYHLDAVPINLKKLWTELDRPPVVALGRRAEHHLTVLAVPHREAPHPQWQRRFSHAQKREYAELILGDLA